MPKSLSCRAPPAGAMRREQVQFEGDQSAGQGS